MDGGRKPGLPPSHRRSGYGEIGGVGRVAISVVSSGVDSSLKYCPRLWPRVRVTVGSSR